MKDLSDIAGFIGRLFGLILVGCVAACLSGALIALTLKLLTWLF